ncbi:MAG: sulfite exporter TauE/SafE family protein [Cyanobacteria bacterium J06621_8]
MFNNNYINISNIFEEIDIQQATLFAHIDSLTWLPVLKEEPTFGAILTGMTIAFGFGAMHALAPGHGKALVSAYLVGSKGTAYQAVLLGLATTITHTFSVFILGLIALFASEYILLEQLYPVLDLISGLTICSVGFWLLMRRLSPQDEHHHHHHSSSNFSNPSTIALGIAGGLVPCPSALVMLLAAISLNQITYGLFLVCGLSLGLASVLITLGLIAVYAKQRFKKLPLNGVFVQRLPIFSAAMVVCIGIGLTVLSLV